MTSSLTYPVDVINDKFIDRKLSYVPVVVKQKVLDTEYWFAKSRGKYRDAEFKFMLELFPKYPAAYRLTEYDEEPAVDAAHPAVTSKQLTLIPGCGTSGCNKTYSICEDVPVGGKPIEAVDFYDSFQGWGGFNGAAALVTSTGVCVPYWQHSHDTARNVGFSVRYYPKTTQTIPHDILLAPISSDSLADVFKDDDQKDTAVAKDTTVTPESAADLRPFTIVSNGVDHGAVRLGRTYNAIFSNNMQSYTLVFRTFTGEELLVTPAKKSDMVDAKNEDLTSFKRMTVAIKPPW